MSDRPQHRVQPQGHGALAARHGGFAAWLCGIGLIAAMAAGAAQGLAALASPAAQRQLGSQLSLSGILNRRFTADVSGIMAHRLPADGWLRAAAGILRWSLFTSGGPQVWIGDDDWLFLTDEIRAWPNGTRDLESRVDIMAEVGRQLARRGIELVVALVPDKADVAASRLGRVPYSAQARARYAEIVAQARAAGLTVVDLGQVVHASADPLGLWYRTDTHWNQVGAALAAQAIAGAIKAPVEKQGRFETRPDSAAAPRAGDLLRLMGLDTLTDHWPVHLRPMPDSERTVHTVQHDGLVQLGGLLDDTSGPRVVLLGTSFSYNGNFHGWLEQALQAPVARFAELGGGFATAAAAYLSSSAFHETPPSVVIWEVPSRTFGRPLDDADRRLAAMMRSHL